MESKTVMLINPAVMTTLIPSYIYMILMVHLRRAVEMSLLKTEKIPVFHRQQFYRYYY